MSNGINERRIELDPALAEKITEWLEDYVKFLPTAYNANGILFVHSIMLGLTHLINAGVFDDAREIKREFGKKYKAIIPDFLF